MSQGRAKKEVAVARQTADVEKGLQPILGKVEMLQALAHTHDLAMDDFIGQVEALWTQAKFCLHKEDWRRIRSPAQIEGWIRHKRRLKYRLRLLASLGGWPGRQYKAIDDIEYEVKKDTAIKCLDLMADVLHEKGLLVPETRRVIRGVSEEEMSKGERKGNNTARPK